MFELPLLGWLFQHEGSASLRLSICFKDKRGQKLFTHTFTFPGFWDNLQYDPAAGQGG